MSESDLKVNPKVRRTLVENNLDLSQLSVSTASGAVTIRGELQRVPSREIGERDGTRLLTLLETLILRTRDVRRVTFHIRNWEKKKGKWRKY